MGPEALAWINAGSNVLGKALAPAPSAAQSSSSAYGTATFDNSGFNVAFGGGNASSSAGVAPWLIGAGVIGAVVVALVSVKRVFKK